MVWTTIWPRSVQSGQWSGQPSGLQSDEPDQSSEQTLFSLANDGQSLFDLTKGGQSLFDLVNTCFWVSSVWSITSCPRLCLANTCLGPHTSSWVVKHGSSFATFGGHAHLIR